MSPKTYWTRATFKLFAAAPATTTVLTAEGAEAAAAMEDANRGLVNFRCLPEVCASCQ